MEPQKFIHPPNSDCLIRSVDGFMVVAQFNNKQQKKITAEIDEDAIPDQRFFGFFSDKKEMVNFTANAPMKIIAIKKVTIVYHDGEGLNYV